MASRRGTIIETCYHCGNTGRQDILHLHKQSWGGRPEELYEEFNWLVLKCPTCGMISLKEDYTNEAMVDVHGEQFFEESIVYPKTKFHFRYTPKSIQRAFESAVKVSKIDPAICLLSLRRTLEMICKNKNAQGNSLEAKIKDLANRNILPATLDDSSWLIRMMGNDAAHADDINYTDYEVEQIIEFVEIIITYLYELPNRIDKLKEARERRLKRK